MNKDRVSTNEGILLVGLFIMGSTLAIGAGRIAGNDAWISIILSIFLALPFILIYIRILTRFPGKDLFDILTITFGRVVGKIISILYIWFAFHLGALVLRNYGEFISTVALINTPQIITMGFLVLLCIWGVKEGLGVLGKWSKPVFRTLMSVIILVTLLQIPNFNIDNIKPILYNGINPVLIGAFGVFSFPMTETVLFTCVLSSIKSTQKIRNIYIYGLLLGGFVVLGTVIHEILALGAQEYTTAIFPSYMVVSRIDIGGFIQRIEILVSITIISGGFIKICICLLATSKGVAKLFGYEDYSFIVMPLGLLMLNLSYLVYDSIIEMNNWAFKIWHYYAFPFEVILPILILAVIEIRKSRKVGNIGGSK